MGKLKSFEILFEGNRDVFKPGDTVRGQVRIVLSGEKGDIRGIHVVFKGKSSTHWSESRGSRNRRRTVHYSWKIPFFKNEIILRGAGKHNKAASRMQLPMGDHRFPFQFLIPNCSLPPPFEGTVGWVRYYIKAEIDRPWKFDHKVKRCFSILTVKDLNLLPNILNMPTSISQKTVCCLCCESGPLSIRATLDKCGYVPGETILVTIELDNRCGRELTSLTATVYQRVIYTAMHGGGTHTRRSSHKTSVLRFEDCNVEGVMTFHRKKLPILAVPPNCFESCPNIDVQYTVEIEGSVSGTTSGVTVVIPIVIGTVPALNHRAQQIRIPNQAPSPMGPPQPAYPPPQGQPHLQQGYPPHPPTPQASAGYQAQPSAPQLPPPPNYEVATEGPQEVNGKMGSLGAAVWAPRYPYYNPESSGPSALQETACGSSWEDIPITSQPQHQPEPGYHHPNQQKPQPSCQPRQQQQQPSVRTEEVELKMYTEI